MIQITIPTDSHLKKFILHRFHSSTGRIEVTTKRSYGIDLLKIFQKRNRPRDRARKHAKYNDTITVNVSEYYMSQAGLFISPENVDLFNTKVKFDFEESLYDHILINLISKKDIIIEEEILNYLSFYRISPDELMLDSVKKDFYRWRKHRKLLIIS